MNYLAHIHLAEHTSTSLVGNFLGDFVKGSDLSALEPSLQQGVKLHRKIDQFTDRHTEVGILKKSFPPDIRRMAGIALDIYFDHLLVSHWSHYSPKPMNVVVDDFYHQLAISAYKGSDYYHKVRQGLLEYRWLSDYQDVSACLRSFATIERRLGHRIEFAQSTFAHITDQSDEINRVFRLFYPQLMDFSTSIVHP